MKEYTLFVFDFDLTLVDSSKAILACIKYTLSEYACDIPSDEVIYNTIGLPLMDSLATLSGNNSNLNIESLIKTYMKKADEIMAKQSIFYPKAIDILNRLQREGKKTAIVSTKYRYRIEETFLVNTDKIPLDCIIGYEDVNVPKPAPNGILKVADILDIALSDILYIGDSYIDAITAQNAGVDFAAITTGSTNSDDFQNYPHVMVTSSLIELFDNLFS